MEQLLDQIRTWRRHLHAIPEIGFQEYKKNGVSAFKNNRDGNRCLS